MTVIKYQGKTEKEKKKACCQTLSKHDFDLRVSEISRSREIRSLVQAGVELAFHAPSLSQLIMRVRKPTVACKLVVRGKPMQERGKNRLDVIYRFSQG